MHGLCSLCVTLGLVLIVTLAVTNMGSLFGKVREEGPPYQVIRSSSLGYEVRSYGPSVVAAVNMAQNSKNNAFRTLARYIGVMGAPENLSSESIPMTVPVGTNSTDMWFYLPIKFASPQAAPAPSNTQIRLAGVPSRTEAVIQFSGTMNEELASQKAKDLLSMLQSEQVTITPEQGWFCATYNPPWTIPSMRTNEVHYSVEWPNKDTLVS
eukprot:GHVN01073212.1.p1 GENE.GHVN01073212.1~~GHVN01073212.1.p1  ORF type:complete len:210 (-),score=11.34 GHVN01073212.1:2033-2662(-)